MLVEFKRQLWMRNYDSKPWNAVIGEANFIDIRLRTCREVDLDRRWIIIDAAYAALNKHEDKHEKSG